MKKNSILTKSSILVIATILSSVCNFLFQLYMGRSLTSEGFGILSSLLSFFIIVSVPAGTLQMVTARYVSKYSASNELTKVKYVITETVKKLGFYVVAGLILFLLSSGFISDFLKITSIVPVLILGLLLAISFFAPIANGALQGLQKFNAVGGVSVVGGVSRILFGVLLVGAGFKVNGALGAFFFSSVASFAVSVYPLWFLTSYKGKIAKLNIKKEVFSYSVFVMGATICFNMLTNIDLILVKHYFEPEVAGSYSSVVVLGKAILYLPGVITIVLFPMVSEAHTNNNDVFHLLNKGLLYTAGLASIGLSGFLIFPEFILNLLYGGKFNNTAGLLQIYAFSMLVMALINVIMNFNLARHHTKFVYSMIVGTILQSVLIVLFHSSLNHVIYINITVGSTVLIYNFAAVFITKKKGCNGQINIDSQQCFAQVDSVKKV